MASEVKFLTLQEGVTVSPPADNPLTSATINAVTNLGYTVLDDDGYTDIYVSTGGSDRTVTLPTAADNDSRILTVKKTDAGSGIVVVDGEGAETIDGATNFWLTAQYNFVTMVCDGTTWHVTNYDVEDVEEIEVTVDTDTVTASVTVDVTGSTLTVPPGTHWLEVDAAFSIANDIASVNNIAVKVEITTSANAVVARKMFNHSETPADAAIAIPIFFRKKISITSETDYKLRLTCSDTAGSAGFGRFHDEEISTTIAGDDSGSFFRRERVVR